MTIERAAKALEAYLPTPELRDAARATIEAIAEPTPEMVEAGRRAYAERDFTEPVAKIIWRAMHRKMLERGS